MNTGIELYVHLEKLEEEVEQFRNISITLGDYVDMYKRHMDDIRYSKISESLYDIPALVRVYDELLEELEKLNKFSETLDNIYSDYKVCNDTYKNTYKNNGLDLGNQYAVTPWSKTNECKIVVGTSIIIGLVVIAIVAPEITGAAVAAGTMTTATADTIGAITLNMAWGATTTSMLSGEVAGYIAYKNGDDLVDAFSEAYMWGSMEGGLGGVFQGVGETAIALKKAQNLANGIAIRTGAEISQSYVNAVRSAVNIGNSAMSTELYIAQEKSHCREVTLEDAVDNYNSNVRYNLITDIMIGGAESVVDNVRTAKTTRSIQAKNNEKSESGKVPSKEQTIQQVTSQYEGYKQNQTFLNGKKTTRNAQGSVSPTLYKEGSCIDVKCYNIQSESGRRQLVREVGMRSEKMKKNLPTGTKQTIIIDVRGRSISNKDFRKLYIDAKCAVDSDVEIKFMR